jgi:hypothetical protein
MTDINNTQVQEQANTDTAVKAKRVKTTIEKKDLTLEKAAEMLEIRSVETGAPAGEDGVVPTSKFLFWKKDTAVAKGGSFAGSIRPADSYYSVVLFGTNYSGKQLIHFLENEGKWPEAVLRTKKDGTTAAAKEAKPKALREFKLPTAEEIAEAKRQAAERAAARKAAAPKKDAPAAETAPEVAGDAPAADSPVADTTADLDSTTL